MAVRTANAQWRGDLKSGEGQVALGSGAFNGPYSFVSRFENGSGTNPEELIGAAHAGCFSMALAHALSTAGHPPTSVATAARVHLDKVGNDFAITRIELDTEVKVSGLSDADFQKHADVAKSNCPVSKVLAGAKIELKARLA